jgi:hypothetical protein
MGLLGREAQDLPFFEWRQTSEMINDGPKLTSANPRNVFRRSGDHLVIEIPATYMRSSV